MTLDEFIRSRIDGTVWPRNAYVEETGFSALYVRVTERLIEGQVRKPVLDLAALSAESPGKGTFTTLVARVRKDWPTLGLFVECVQTRRFGEKLITLGFRLVSPQCYWMPPIKENDSGLHTLLF